MAGIYRSDNMAEQENRGGRYCPAGCYTIWDVAEKLGIPKATMMEYVIKGDFREILPDIASKVMKIGTSYVFPKNLLNQYLKQGMFWNNTNKNGTAGRPARWVEGEYRWVKFRAPNNIYKKFCFMIKKANEMSPGNYMSKGDTYLLAMEEFIERRPELLEGYNEE